MLHRGYNIEDLAEKSSFLEVCYLLLHGELPTASEFAEFEHTITYHTMLHAQFDRFFSRLQVGRAPDGDHDRRGGCAVGVLSRQHQRR